MLDQQQRDGLLPWAYNAAVRAGAAILKHYTDEDYDQLVEIKKDLTPLTVADSDAHSCIKAYLGPTHIPVLSEEGREMLYAERMGWDLFWLVDPLDGTKEFLKHNGEFTVNIALISDGQPVLGVVYTPFVQKMFFADIERGSFRKLGVGADSTAGFGIDEIYKDVERLPLADRSGRPVRIAVSRSHNTQQTYDYIARLRERYPDAEVVEQGSSYKFCMLAEGSVDCYVRHTFTYEWDTAAGELILAAAGGHTLSLPELKPLAYNKESIENPYFVCGARSFPAEEFVGQESGAVYEEA